MTLVGTRTKNRQWMRKKNIHTHKRCERRIRCSSTFLNIKKNKETTMFYFCVHFKNTRRWSAQIRLSLKRSETNRKRVIQSTWTVTRLYTILLVSSLFFFSSIIGIVAAALCASFEARSRYFDRMSGWLYLKLIWQRAIHNGQCFSKKQYHSKLL